MRRLIIVLAVLALSGAAAAHPPGKKLDCKRVKEQIRYVQAKMRAGYTRAQGEKLEARLRELRSKRAKACR